MYLCKVGGMCCRLIPRQACLSCISRAFYTYSEIPRYFKLREVLCGFFLSVWTQKRMRNTASEVARKLARNLAIFLPSWVNHSLTCSVNSAAGIIMKFLVTWWYHTSKPGMGKMSPACVQYMPSRPKVFLVSFIIAAFHWMWIVSLQFGKSLRIWLSRYFNECG